MGFGGYLDTYKVYEVIDYYGNQYQKGTLAISVDIYGTLTWVLTMNNGNNGAPDGYGRAVGLYLNIDGNALYNSYTDYSPNYSTSKWNTFPTGNDTSASGQFTVGTSSFAVTLGISCMQSNVTINGTTGYYTFERDYWDTITKSPHSPEIIDNGDNSFYLKGYKATSAHNNSVDWDAMIWTIQSTVNQNVYGWLVDESGNYFTAEMGSDPTTNGPYYLANYGQYPETSPTRDVALLVRSVGVRGDIVDNGYIYAGIKQYFPPSAPGTPVLTPSSYKNNRLTIKNNWTFTWGAATQANASSPVKGYRIRLYKNVGNGLEQINLVNHSTEEGFYDTDGLTTGHSNLVEGATYSNLSFTINPITFGFKPGDTVRLMLYSYTRNGNGAQLFNDNGAWDKGVPSDDYTVENSGVVRIRDGSNWKEGQVYVYEGTWKEASTVYVRDNNEWKEST